MGARTSPPIEGCWDEWSEASRLRSKVFLDACPLFFTKVGFDVGVQPSGCIGVDIPCCQGRGHARTEGVVALVGVPKVVHEHARPDQVDAEVVALKHQIIPYAASSADGRKNFFVNKFLQISGCCRLGCFC